MSIPTDYAEDLIRGQKTISSSVMAQLILAFQKSIKVPEDDTVIDNLIFSPLIDIHNTSFDIFGSDLESEEFTNHTSSLGYRKILKTPFHSDPLTYDLSNALGIAFPQPAKHRYKVRWCSNS